MDESLKGRITEGWMVGSLLEASLGSLKDVWITEGNERIADGSISE